ncbi:reverse transcriptase [Mycena venus]|uniref:Reverse transcriptase n=1 Tax=Mycena venus TaxID=2733690 RepID=A0A8H7DGG5_9AGAR|nr:reverse transcriptase [Mycena venus]
MHDFELSLEIAIYCRPKNYSSNVDLAKHETGDPNSHHKLGGSPNGHKNDCLAAIDCEEDDDNTTTPPSQSTENTIISSRRNGVDITLPFFRDLFSDAPISGADEVGSLGNWSEQAAGGRQMVQIGLWQSLRPPDSHGQQMGYIRRTWPVIAPWVCHIFQSSVRLGLYPYRLKASNAIPTPKPAKKDKTHPKAYRPVEQHAEVLAKPLERLMADRISFEAETRGLLHQDQFGGRPGHSTQQAASAFIHRVRGQLDDGMVVSTLVFDLKGAFNGISHRVVVEELVACSFSHSTIFWVLAFLDGHRVTIVIDRKRTIILRCTDKGAPQGSALSVILFLLCINRLLRRLAVLCVVVKVGKSWLDGFVDDVIFSTASRSILRGEASRDGGSIQVRGGQNRAVPHVAGSHGPLLSLGAIRRYGGPAFRDGESWAVSATRALNAMIVVVHSSWGLCPQFICNLIGRPLHQGSFCTASLVALEKEAAILQAQLRIKREALLAVSQMLLHDAIAAALKNPKLASMLHFVEQIPEVKWPPLVPVCGQRLCTRGTARTTDSSECAGSVFDSSLGMEPILPVYAASWSPPLPVTLVILAKEEALQALEIVLDDSRHYRATWFTDGSLLDGKVGGATVQVENAMVREKIVVLLGDGQVCEGEMEGLLQTMEKALCNDQDNILCIADSQATLRGILLTTPRSGQF